MSPLNNFIEYMFIIHFIFKNKYDHIFHTHENESNIFTNLNITFLCENRYYEKSVSRYNFT